MEEEKKKPYLSKTLWLNAVVAVVAFFPNMIEHFSAANVAMFLSVINMVLRMVTKDKIGLNE